MSGFDEFLAPLDYPMFVVTATGASRRAGCLVGFTSQASIDPSRFVVFLSNKNHTFGVAKSARSLAVHTLGADRLLLAELFGSRTGDDIDKFRHCRWQRGPGGAAILDEATSWFVGRIVDLAEYGDHTGFVLEPITGHDSGGYAMPDSGHHGQGRLLSFRDVRHLSPGHSA